MTEERPKFMTITVYNEPDLPCRVQFHGGRLVEAVSPMTIIEGVSLALLEAFRQVAEAEKPHLN